MIPTRMIPPNQDGVHDTHCCSKCGCKYGEDDCPVVSGRLGGVGECEDCPDNPKTWTEGFLKECDKIIEEWGHQPTMLLAKTSYQIGYYKGFCLARNQPFDTEAVEKIKNLVFN